ncbi:pyrimidine reductase family protein [Nocardia sp. NPDC050406]|uniref:pyrimidine reductase family protein n=1 Tax=Nocardia sp. NPDC050406 TaxID=3364318 RepID=UPI00379C5CE2
MTTVPHVVNSVNLTDDELAALYEYPANSEPWVRANFVVSIDGAISTNGSSVGLTTPLDQKVLKLLRDLSDVVLVGANTIRVEDYIGIKVSEAGSRRRTNRGLSPVPPLAVVSGRADIDPQSRLLTNTTVPPIILTTSTAPTVAKRNLTTAGAQVIELGPGPIETTAIIDTLSSLGMTKILCEGGPNLTGQLVADHLLNEMCVTTAPTMICGNAQRITHLDRHANLKMRCKHIIFDPDGAQLARWITNEQPSSGSIT